MEFDIFRCDHLSSPPTSNCINQSAQEKITLFEEEKNDPESLYCELELLEHKITLGGSSTDDIVHYFSLFKKIVCIFRMAITGKRTTREKNYWVYYRRQIFKFLLGVSKSIKHMKLHESAIIKELVNLISFMGRLSMLEEYDPNIYLISGDVTSSSHQYFHLCLDIWWMTFQILCDYNRRTHCKVEILSDVNNPEDFYTIFVESMLSDLIFISLQRFTTSKDLRMITTLSPFTCSCHQTFYAIIKNLLEKDNSILNIHPFWYYINAFIDSITDENFKGSRERESLTTFRRVPYNFVPPKNLDLASLWLISNLMELVCFSKETSSNQDICNSIGFFKAINSILRSNETSGYINNEQIEIALQLCLNSAKYCNICADLPIPFIDYYMRMLNAPDTQSKSFYILPKSGNQWSLKLRTLFERGSALEWDDKLLGLLLLLLEKVISKLFNKTNYHNLQLWTKLKNQFYLSLSTRRIEEMDENSLFKLLSILIVFCCSSDDRYVEITEKMSEIGKILTRRSVYTKKVTLFIRSIICSALLLPDDKDMNKLLIITTEIFDKVAETLSRLDKSNRVDREACVQIILVYFEEMVYLCEVKVESFGVCQFIPSSIVKVFGQLADRDLYNMVTSIGTIVRVVRSYLPMAVDSNYKHSYGNFLSNVHRYFLPFVRAQYVKGLINQMDLSETAGNLTYLSLFKDSGKLYSTEFRANLTAFTCSSRVDLRQREKFCEALLDNSDPVLLQEVKSLLPDLMERFLKADEAGQTRIKTVLIKLILYITNNDTKPDEYFNQQMSDFINRNLSVQSSTKLFRLFEIVTSLLPELKQKLVSTVAQRIHEMELEGNRGTADIREALRKFFHSVNR